ncbi:uncharacterized protein LOC110106074 [Dendrobium catenatum]|uniref:Uncharacterized protein n=1 Tax=Dendrobium catenatum TaxID=906689 RepID=A0A2I0VQK4_9ASPA|nr:uncharacterized protein LOC110106074 [Dendrobium catenatum]PKU65688.1 hypothetical protein MA16_Dca009725 [Dendrobium catenatum]
MEAIKSLKFYWRRRAYQRLEDVPASKKLAVVRLGAGQKSWRRSWKAVAVRPALRLKRLIVLASPGKLLARLRDAYMNGMLMLAGGAGAAARKNGAVWDRRIPRARHGSLRGGDFEKRLMIHLYNSVIATR